MNLPAIKIPYSASRDKNEKRFGWPAGPICLLCHKPMKESQRTHWVQLDEGLGKIIDPHVPSEQTGGGFPVGPDCWRKNPQLNPYEVRAFRETESGTR